MTSIYSKEHFANKKVFWDAHQTMLNELCNKVSIEGFPVFVNDAYLDLHERMNNIGQFYDWLKNNQQKESFDYLELKMTLQ